MHFNSACPDKIFLSWDRNLRNPQIFIDTWCQNKLRSGLRMHIDAANWWHSVEGNDHCIYSGILFTGCLLNTVQQHKSDNPHHWLHEQNRKFAASFYKIGRLQVMQIWMIYCAGNTIVSQLKILLLDLTHSILMQVSTNLGMASSC